MLKKRILASSLASVMALSSISVVAFADETAEADFGEVVDRSQLKEYLKKYDNLIAGEINSYGSVQALRFQEAYSHATYVAGDSEATETDFIAAYQMVKAVYETLEQYDNDQLKALIEEWKPVYDRNNILNAEILDNIYDVDAFAAFKTAYEEAEVYVTVDDLMMVTDAYIKLYEAANALEGKKLTPVSKTEYRAIIKEYEGMIAQFGKNELWRRGTVSVSPVTGEAKDGEGKKIKLADKAAYVTWGELQDIVFGTSNEDVVTAVNKVDRGTVGSESAEDDTVLAPTTGTWVAVSKTGAATVENLIYTQSKVFDDYKSASKTTDVTIKKAYNAAVEAIKVFKSWKAIDLDSTAKGQANTTLNNYRTKLANDFEKTLIGTLTDMSFADLKFGSTATAALVYDPAKGTLKGVKGAADAGCILRIDSSTGLIQLDKVVGAADYEDAVYDPADHSGDATPRKSYTIKIAEGVDYMKYIPVRSGNIAVGTGKGIATDATTQVKVANVAAAVKLYEDYNLLANNTKATADNWKTLFGTADSKAFEAGTYAPVDEVADLDENTTVTKPAGSAREFTLINRYLSYALSDLYPAEKAECSHTRADVKALIEKAYDLINETGSSNIFADANKNLANARKEAVEWVRESEKDKLYKDNDADHGKFQLGDTPPVNLKNATEVYHTLAHKGTKYYDVLADLLKEYPTSYGEIAEKIAEVNKAYEDGKYSDKVKDAVDDVAYCLSVLKASDIGNEAFNDERALNVYNRLRYNKDKSTDSEKALKAALDNLNKAIEEDVVTPEPEIVLGDLDGDNKVTPKDAAMVIELVLNDAEYNKAADFNKDGKVNPLDAAAIVEAFLNA